MRKPTPEERRAVAQAVHAAEGGTSGEIVTIIADRSDSYHDVGLHYAIAAMLIVPLLFAAWPAGPAAVVSYIYSGWGSAEVRDLMLLTFFAMGVVFLIVRYGLAYMPLRLWLTPKATRRRRVRRRALELFKVGTEARTAGRTGILIYLSLGEHMAEIIADSAIHRVVADTEWGEAMAAMIAQVRQDRIADGMIAAVDHVGRLLAQHLPRADDDVNELPDRLIEL
ncbi:TPM domain-containing protein [Sphingomonas immobilis]|uniref:TPM domain-containing protein n=1 Tax=Sphingomonas immobilis TaxID=3063997 RepID=A0ABT9A4D8_9SPHN|nr:hypothetical protein [Sphingomonas sp. CA1-15]MDO7844710.1 hypothetical protein [Sphingomonas sp. CA1-15]